MSFTPDLPLLLLSLASSNVEPVNLPVIAAGQEHLTSVEQPIDAQAITEMQPAQAQPRSYHMSEISPIAASAILLSRGAAELTTMHPDLPCSVPLNDETLSLGQQTSKQDSSQQDPEEQLPEPIVVDGIELDVVDELSMETFEIVDAIDLAVVEPAVDFYRDTIPSPIREASQNFLRNLGEPVNFINYLLQLKPGKAIETAGRFLINSTLGLGGLIDLAAKPGINLPYHYNGFANTFGYYGIKPGRYLYLPLLGSTTPRDLIGDTLDRVLVPFIYGPPVNRPLFAFPAGAVSTLNLRLANDEAIDRIRQDSADPFGDTRDAYLLFRENRIRELRGLPPLTSDDPLIIDEEIDNDNPGNLPEQELEQEQKPQEDAVDIDATPEIDIETMPDKGPEPTTQVIGAAPAG